MDRNRIYDIYNEVVNGVKQIGKFGYYTFSDSVLAATYHLSYKDVDNVLDYLVKKKKLNKIYRIYDPYDAGKYIDFHNAKDIPEDETVCYKHIDSFFVSRYDKADIFYSFSSKYFNKLRNSGVNNPKILTAERGNELKCLKNLSKKFNSRSVLVYIIKGGVNTMNNSTNIDNSGTFNNNGNIGNKNSYNANDVLEDINNGFNKLAKRIKDKNINKNVNMAKKEVGHKHYKQAVTLLHNIVKGMSDTSSITGSIYSIIKLISHLFSN